MSAPDIVREYVVQCVRFTIEIPGSVEIPLPWGAINLHVGGDAVRGWELVYICPRLTDDLKKEAPHLISAAPVGAVLPLGRRLNVTERETAEMSPFDIGGILREPTPPIVWSTSP